MQYFTRIIRSLTSAEAKGILFRNTLLLYVLQFSGYFFALLTIPYQTRILGPENFGKLGYAIALMVFVELFIDFGFILHATSEVSKKRDDKHAVSRILTSVITVKVFLALIAAAAVCTAALIIPSMRADFWLYALFLLATITNSFMPDFVYRGIEKMFAITVRTVIIKATCTLLIFAFLKDANDYYLVPLLTFAGNGLAILGVYVHLHRHLDIRFVRTSVAHTVTMFKEASQFFYSRIATALYGAANTMILGAVSPGTAVGYYASADKLITAAKSVMAPIADSTYPYMIKNRDFKLIAKILKIALPVVAAGTAVTFVFAEQLCVLVFGKDFAGAADVLRALLPIAVVILPNYLLGFPTLGAMGLSRYANLSIFAAALFQLAALGALFMTGHLTMITLALVASAAEVVVLVYRSTIIYRNRHLLTTPDA